MMSAMLTVEKIRAGRTVYDVWRVKRYAEYHEARARGGDAAIEDRSTPKRV